MNTLIPPQRPQKVKKALQKNTTTGFAMKKMEKKRSLGMDMVRLAGLMMVVWGGTHLAMNRSAYTQLAAFRYDELKASVIETSEAQVIREVPKKQVEKSVATLEKVEEKRPTYFRDKELTPKNQLKNTFEKIKVYPSDNRVVLPDIDKNVPLVEVPNHQNWNQLENNIQDGLRNGVVVHPVSHSPGNFGNFFITGHSSYYTWDDGRFKDVFALLHEMEVGQTVEIYWEGKKYVYEINEIEVVPPTAVEVLDQPTDRSILTLMTCTPIGTNKNRLILRGDFVGVE